MKGGNILKNLDPTKVMLELRFTSHFTFKLAEFFFFLRDFNFKKTLFEKLQNFKLFEKL